MGSAAAQKALHIMQADNTRPGSTLQPAPPIASVCGDHFVTRALLFMEQHIGSPRSVAQVAAHVHVSSRTLERLFKKNIGVGPLAAYLKLRLKHAHWMLRSQIPLVVVGIRTGFASGSHFSAAFKRNYGYTPSEVQSRFAAAAKLLTPTVARCADQRVFSG